MDTASVDDFQALNEHLAALVAAGVPLDVGLSGGEHTADNELKRIGATVSRRLHRGETFSEALDDDADMPAAYRSAMQFGLRSGDLTSALPGASLVAQSMDDSRRAVETSFVYPAIICALAYVGLLGFSRYLTPVLQSLYASLKVPPGRGVHALQVISAALPYWAIGLPVVFVVIWLWWARSRRTAESRLAVQGPLRWLPGTKKILLHEQWARFASSLAELLAHETPLNEALPIAANLSGDARLLAGALAIAAAKPTEQLPPYDGDIALHFPPFLRWSIWHGDSTTGLVRALEIAARLYRESAERRAERQRVLLPITVLVVIGGTVTLLYGLALFVPLTELLRTVAAAPHGA